MDLLYLVILLQMSLSYADHTSNKLVLWRRNITDSIDLEVSFELSASNLGQCSLRCDQSSNCGSFLFDIQSKECMGFHTYASSDTTVITANKWYFSPHNESLIHQSDSGSVINSGSNQQSGSGFSINTTCIDEGGELSQYLSGNRTVYNFTTCTQTGTTGPTLQMCTSNMAWITDSDYSLLASGVYIWTVPETTIYRIEASGAAGGNGNGGVGGKGASVAGDFHLSNGTVLNIVCGQKGGNGGPSDPGGGGGGTFVYTGEVNGGHLLMAAGGGGGAGEEDTRDGFDGHCEQQALCNYGYCGSNLTQIGGIGYGGIGGSKSTAGAGWLSDGGDGRGNPGARWIGGSADSNGGFGGFGGGGSGVSSNGGGGGGGFTGGHGTSSSDRTLWGGSGAGSFNGGTNRTSASGYNNGDGNVIIIKL